MTGRSSVPVLLFIAGTIVAGQGLYGLHRVTSPPITAETAIDRAKLFPTGSCSSDDWRTAWPARDGMRCLTEDQGLARKPPVARWQQL